MAPSPNEKKNLESLHNIVAVVSALISQLEAAVKTPPNAQTVETAKTSDINALDLAHDAAKLIRAHSTKLSLLIINDPFTPTAITKALGDLAAGPLPVLATAVELCDSTRYTKIAQTELLWRVQKVLSEFGKLLREVPLDGKVLNADQKNGTGATAGKGSLASTGVVWQACDSLIELRDQGIAGLIVKKAEQYRDTLKDAIEELHEWGDEESDDEEGDDAASEDDDEHNENTAQDDIDDFFGEPLHIPHGDPEKIRPRLQSSIRRQKLMVLLYNAAIKRRLKTLSKVSFPAPPMPSLKGSSAAISAISAEENITQRVDAIVDSLKPLPDTADELANAFYELDSDAIDKTMKECFDSGVKACDLMLTDWEGKEDEFTVWVSFPNCGKMRTSDGTRVVVANCASRHGSLSSRWRNEECDVCG